MGEPSVQFNSIYFFDIPYPRHCNPGVLFFKMGFWVRFYSKFNIPGVLIEMGLYFRNMMIFC